MRGKYWFNSEPISKHIDIVFEYDKYQFVNEVVQLCSIQELKDIASSIKKRIENLRPYSFAKEYFNLHLDFGLCCIEYELPDQSYTCYMKADSLVEILERYVYTYEHLDDWFKKI